LLTLARAHQVDLARLSLTALLARLEAALQQAPVAMPLGQKADWVLMAAWLLQFRSRLLLPADAPARRTPRRKRTSCADVWLICRPCRRWLARAAAAAWA
jgi:chromatin segregation and condensation protein Rec8/ScpA/Scc1 (kleisin family)